PKFVVEVFYRGIGRQKLLRQPSLKAVRPDKKIADLADSDRASAAPPGAAKAAKKAPATTAKAEKKSPRGAASVGAATAAKARHRQPPTLSSPTKILYPDI